MRYPFDATAWWRYHRAVAATGQPWRREAAGRLLLAAGAALPWALQADAPPPARTVIIVGHQRSGTTWLHRMLARHPAASSLPLHALIFPGAPWMPAEPPGWLARAQDRRLGAMDDVHRLRLHEVEEDELALWPLYRSPMNALDRPWDGAAPAPGDDGPALAYYAQLVGRAVIRSGRRHVGKNPHFTWRIPALRAALPGVKVVALWRDPLDALPSRLGLLRELWRLRFPQLDRLREPDIERVYASSCRTWLGGLGQADLDLRYADLVADPHGTVRRVHEAFGLEPWSEADLTGLDALREGPSRRRFTLEEFGLDPARVRRDLAPVWDAGVL